MTSPEVGVSTVPMTASRVLLPAPFGPSRNVIVPASKRALTARRAGVAPNNRVTSSHFDVLDQDWVHRGLFQRNEKRASRRPPASQCEIH